MYHTILEPIFVLNGHVITVLNMTVTITLFYISIEAQEDSHNYDNMDIL